MTIIIRVFVFVLFVLVSKSEVNGKMASVTFARSVLVDKEYSRSVIWKYFVYEVNEYGKSKDISKLICKRCYRIVLIKGVNIINIVKYLRDRYSDLYKEFFEVGIIIIYYWYFIF